MSISISTLKKSSFFLAVTLSFFISSQAQNNPAAARLQAIKLLQKNLRSSGLNQSLLDAYQVTDAYPDKRSGNFHVYLQQVYLGIPVYNKIAVYVFKGDTLLQKRTDFISRLPGAEARTAGYSISPAQAVRFAAAHVSIALRQEPQLLRKDELRKHFVYASAELGLDSISSDLVWLPVNNDTELKLSWNVRIVSPDGRNDWFVRVDAQTGEYLDKNSLVVSENAGTACTDGPPAMLETAPPVKPVLPAGSLKTSFAPPAVGSASYRVYPLPVESPNFASRTLETNPWLKAGNNASTLGWHSDNTSSYDITRGNNVWAQEDLAGTSATSGLTDNSATAIPTLTFDKTIDFSLNPGTGSNLRAAIDNIFYWNNLMHDISYQYGFDEASGNFQASNQGRGGTENDYVNAFAEDGISLNNADFATPPDGQRPRMRMYEWNLSLVPAFHVNAPAAIVNNYTVVESGVNLHNQLGNTGPKTGNIILVNDAAGTHQACGTISNLAALSGNIALLDRGGSCNFGQKIKTVQNAGAIAVIIANNVAGAPIVIGVNPADNTITIPAVMISLTDGNTLKANTSGLNGTLSTSGTFKDGALDNVIISHEYTHGISNRLTGGPANAGCLVNAEQMGEGWSDYMALMVTTNWATAGTGDGANNRTVGTYAASQSASGPGIRTYPYTTNMAVNPWTYGMMAGSTNGEVHTIGEIWCSTIWDMTWNIIQQEGIDPDIYHGTKGNNIALELVIQAMKYQPCSPGFLDGRDAILKADSILYHYTHKCAIWNAFARRGMGKSAQQGSSNSYTDQVAATDLPVALGISTTASKRTVVNGDQVSYTIKATCDCAALNNISIVDTLSANVSFLSAPGGIYTAPYVYFDGLNFAPNETKTFTVNAAVSGVYASPVILINDSRDPDAYTWTSGFVTGGTNWVESASRSHSPSHAWLATDQATATDFTLTSGNLLLDSISTLSFWHYFETDPAFDGGLVEISTDGGSTWKDLGPYMIQNAYNSSINPSALNAVVNRPAFSGSSGGNFIQTIIALTDFAGVTAKIRFRFTSDASEGAEGWYIDDILLKNEKGITNKAYAYNGAALLAGFKTYSLFAAGALPVHFTSFDAQKQNNAALLHWKVSAETNVAKYVVERSADGNSFTSVGELAYTNTGSAEKDYYFTDNQPLTGNNYYRIAEKDQDGRTTFSVVKLLLFTGDGETVRLLPVPTYNHFVQLEIASGDAGTFNAYLLNTLGQAIKSYPVKNGINQLDLQNLSKGVYYLKIQLSKGHTELRKLVIE